MKIGLVKHKAKMEGFQTSAPDLIQRMKLSVQVRPARVTMIVATTLIAVAATATVHPDPHNLARIARVGV